jgi:hypothetical protein
VPLADRVFHPHDKFVFWVENEGKWKAECEGRDLGLHNTEKAAARAYRKFLEGGVVLSRRGTGGGAARGGVTGGGAASGGSCQFAGVTWVKAAHKWKAICKVGRCRLTR